MVKTNAVKVLLAMFLMSLFYGCAEITPKDPIDAVTHPFAGELRIGMQKEKIAAEWGQPDFKVDRGTNELGAPKEEWVYKARYRGVPMDVKYLSKTKHLIFEGNVLTKWSVE